MPKTIPASLTQELTLETNAPIELYEIYLKSQTYYYANAEQDITLGAQTYTALAISRNKIKTHMSSKVDEISITFDNTDRVFAATFLSGNFQGKQIIIKKVLRGHLDSADKYIPMFDGRVDGANIGVQTVSVRAVSWLDAVTKRYPGRTFQKQCNYKLGDTACNVITSSAVNMQTGSIIGASSSTIYTNSLSEDDDHWNNGHIEITAGTNAGYSRPVRDFASGTPAHIVLRLPFPTPCDVTSVFSIHRGCNKTENECNTKFSNITNYGGFPTIPRKPLF